MAFDINVYNKLSTDVQKVQYLAAHKGVGNDTNTQLSRDSVVLPLLKNVDVGTDVTAGTFILAVQKNVSPLEDYLEELSFAIQKTADTNTLTSGEVSNENQTFTQLIRDEITNGNKDIILALAQINLFIQTQNENNYTFNSAAAQKLIKDGTFGTGTTNLGTDLQGLVLTALSDKLSTSADPVTDDASSILNNIEATEAAGGSVQSQISANTANTEANNTPSEEEVEKFKQCVLMLDFLNRASSFVYDPKNPDSTVWGTDLSPYNKNTHNGRILPLWCKKPEMFLNTCHFNPRFKDYFGRSSISDAEEEEYEVSLFYVESITDDEGRITGTTEVELDIKDTDCTLQTVTIDYKGTTPATARKDVAIKMSWKINNFNKLKKDISKSKTGFKFYELITVPYGVAKGSTVGGSSIRSQYSPDYSRLRLKIKSKSNLKKYIELGGGRIKILKDSNGKSTGKPDYKADDFDTISDDYYIDLAITNHTMDRSNDTSHNVTVNIDYRGYFENMLSMPFMDALATRKNIKDRFERDRELIKISKDCDPKTFREIVRLNRIGDSAEATFSNFTSKLQLMGNIFFNYTPNSSVLFDFLNGGITTMQTSTNFISNISTAGGTSVDNTGVEIDENNSQTVTGLKPGIFCRLGDIMEAALDQMYETNSGDFIDEFKHLNLKFVFAPVTIINPFDTSRMLTFNPLEMPIDFQFFTRWYNATVVNKKLSYYPVLTFIRDLTERVINGVLFEACLGARLPDERPPMLRSGFFYCNKTSPQLHEHERNGYYIDLDNYIDSSGATEKVFQYSQKNGSNGLTEKKVTNYCVIYSQSSNFFQMKSGIPMKASKYVPTFRSGLKYPDGFIKDLTFTQKAQNTGLREAKFFNSNNGLQVLSNVYDFTFTFKNRKPNNMLFPGQIISFELFDFDKGDLNPHILNTLANILSMGGYYMIKSVTHSFDVPLSKFTIKYETLWQGNDISIKFRSPVPGEKSIEENEACLNVYEKALQRARKSDPLERDTIQGVTENAVSGAKPIDAEEAKRIKRQIVANEYDLGDPAERKGFEGRLSAYLQSSGFAYKTVGDTLEFSGETGQNVHINLDTPASGQNKIAEVTLTYSGVSGWGASGDGSYLLNLETGLLTKK